MDLQLKKFNELENRVEKIYKTAILRERNGHLNDRVRFTEDRMRKSKIKGIGFLKEIEWGNAQYSKKSWLRIFQI